MHRVTTEIRFSYGHRLPEHAGKCAHLHGHNAKVWIEASSAVLNSQGMVIDFHEIKEAIGRWIDEALDHKMILFEKDPLVAKLKESGEPVVLTRQPPTAEVLAEWIFEKARSLRLPVSRVTFWETEDSFAVFHE